MKYFYTLFTLLFFTSTILCQSKEELELRERFWDPADTKKNIVDIPEKWKDESAVVIYREESFEYTNNGKLMYNPSYYHQRVKLLDKAAVEAFSEFTYSADEKKSMGFNRYFEEKKTVGIKIIKPGGEENILDIDSEKVTHDKEIKIAVPGLEVGDIIDIFVYEDNLLRSFTGTHYYDPVEKVLSTKYPIMYRKIAVEVERSYFLNMETYNGAPKIVEEETERRKTRKYYLEIADLEKSDFPRWYYPLVELPTVKFQITFAQRSKNEKSAEAFLADNDTERKYNVTHDEILGYFGDRFNTASSSQLKRIRQYLKEKDITDPREQIIQSLYFMRHKYYNMFFEIAVARENNISTNFTPCDSDFAFLDEERFVQYMAGMAKLLDIDYDILVATAEYNGSIDDLLLRSNVSYGLRFNFDQPLYLFHLTSHAQADYFPHYLEGTKVYNISVRKNRKLEELTTDFLPVTNARENKAFENIKVNIDKDFNGMKIERELRFSGHFKTRELDRRLFLGDFLDEEFDHYNTHHYYSCRDRETRSGTDVKNKLQSVMKTYKEHKEKNLEEIVGNSFDTKIDDYAYNVIASSRYSNDPLIIQDTFGMNDDFIKKAGPNYIVEIGKLIGGQVQIKEDERERKLGVYLDYAKSFNYEIEIPVPAGYEVVGIEKLQHNVKNSTGAFISSARVENGVLKYTTEKIYDKKNYTVSEWQEMLPWLDAAFDFSQEKVMFRKI